MKCSHFIVVPPNCEIVKKKQAKFCKKCKQWVIDDQEKMEQLNRFLGGLRKINLDNPNLEKASRVNQEMSSAFSKMAKKIK